MGVKAAPATTFATLDQIFLDVVRQVESGLGGDPDQITSTVTDSLIASGTRAYFAGVVVASQQIDPAGRQSAAGWSCGFNDLRVARDVEIRSACVRLLPWWWCPCRWSDALFTLWLRSSARPSSRGAEDRRLVLEHAERERLGEVELDLVAVAPA